MPPETHDKSSAITERQAGALEEHLLNIDKRLDGQDGMLKCILEGINGTAQIKGIAGYVRDFNAWRTELDTPKPLKIQLEEIRLRHEREDAEAKQRSQDWRNLAFPVISQVIITVLSVAGTLLVMFRAGLIH